MCFTARIEPGLSGWSIIGLSRHDWFHRVAKQKYVWGCVLMESTEKRSPDVKVDKPAVAKYPDNQLKLPVRAYADTQSVFALLRETFFESNKK